MTTEVLDLEPEQWRAVPGYEMFYSVSTLGRVRSEGRLVTRSDGIKYRKKPRIMRPSRGKVFPYQSVRLFNQESVARTCYVHHLVLSAFVGPMPPGKEACHSDGNPANNRISNLRWDTRAGNHADKNLHGTSTSGERHPPAKLTAEAVRAMRKRVADGAAPSALFKEFGVARMTAYRAATGKSWSHL